MQAGCRLTCWFLLLAGPFLAAGCSNTKNELLENELRHREFQYRDALDEMRKIQFHNQALQGRTFKQRLCTRLAVELVADHGADSRGCAALHVGWPGVRSGSGRQDSRDSGAPPHADAGTGPAERWGLVESENPDAERGGEAERTVNICVAAIAAVGRGSAWSAAAD